MPHSGTAIAHSFPRLRRFARKLWQSPLQGRHRAEGTATLEVFAISEAAHSKMDLGRNVMDARDNYPDAVWNIATDLCDNPSLAAAGVRCLSQPSTQSKEARVR